MNETERAVLLASNGLPDKSSVTVQTEKGKHRYYTPDGEFWGVTSFLKADGSRTEGLIRWAATLERKSVVEAAIKVAKQEVPASEFALRLEAALPEAREHQRALETAGNYGTEVHRAIESLTHGEQLEMLSVPAALSVDKWKSWWVSSGLSVVSTEQPIWHKEHGYAGTIDLVAADKSGNIGIVDYKSGSGPWPSHHRQLAAYFFAAREFVPVSWALLVRAPIKEGDALTVTEMGQFTKKRRISPERLFESFLACKTIWETDRS